MQNVISLEYHAPYSWNSGLEEDIVKCSQVCMPQLPGLFLVCKVFRTGEYSAESLKGEFGDSINSELAERPVLGLGKFIQKESARKVTMGIIVVLMNFSCQW
jgi:hypothetical protein